MCVCVCVCVSQCELAKRVQRGLYIPVTEDNKMEAENGKVEQARPGYEAQSSGHEVPLKSSLHHLDRVTCESCESHVRS